MEICNVPNEFLAPTNLIYPQGNLILFEKFFHKQAIKTKPDISSAITYLPIYWTDYYINHGFGASIAALEDYIRTLDKTKKYFTIVQYDDAILNPAAKEIDLYVITQGTTKNSNYVIPLNCLPDPNIKTLEKNIFCSFFGRYTTHPIREKMKYALEHKSNYVLSTPVSYHIFSEMLSRSLFCLCPRGYGETSFRICEALQRGAIPVYISDVFAVPFSDKVSFEDYGVLIHENDIQNIDTILRSLTKEQVESKINIGKTVYSKFYDYNGCFNSVISHIKETFNDKL